MAIPGIRAETRKSRRSDLEPPRSATHDLRPSDPHRATQTRLNHIACWQPLSPLLYLTREAGVIEGVARDCFLWERSSVPNLPMLRIMWAGGVPSDRTRAFGDVLVAGCQEEQIEDG
jgi:hypothetical protein